MLGADALVSEAERLGVRAAQDALRSRGERDLAGGRGTARRQHRADALLHDGCLQPEPAECAPTVAELVAQEADQDVLGADRVVAQSPSFLLGEDDHLASRRRVALEHGQDHPLRKIPNGARGARSPPLTS